MLKIAVFVFCLNDAEIEANSSILRCKKFKENRGKVKKNVVFFSIRGEGVAMVWTHDLVSMDSNIFKKIPFCYATYCA